MRILAMFAISVSAWAQTRPQLGKMVDTNGAVRTVYGIAFSVTLGEPDTTKVLSAACSNSICLAKADAAILSQSGSTPAPPGPALFAFDADAAFVWFTKSRQLAKWRNGALTDLPSVDINGEVLSIAANSGTVQFAVRRRNGIWIVNQDGSVIDSLPQPANAVMLIPGGAVYATKSEVVIRALQLPLAGVTSFSQMSGSYLQVWTRSANYSLRIDPGHEALFELPGVSQ